MFRHQLVALSLYGFSAIALAAPNGLSLSPNADAGVNLVPSAITATVGSGVINSPVFVDYDTNAATIVADSNNAAATTIRSLATGNPVNHAPYAVLTVPASGVGIMDSSVYTQFNSQGAIASLPGALRGGSPPGPVQLDVSRTVVSSSNSGDGGTGWGVEFALSPGYLGLNTTSDSNDTGIMGGFLLGLLYNHSGFTPYDVHATLRQTAANWPTGYDQTHFGFGSVNWTSANAISSTASIFLQGPHLQLQDFGFYAILTLYPFRTTRRVNEVVYIGGTWPAASTVNELTATQIAAAGGTLIYTSNGTDVTPQFTYAPAVSGTATFYALTLDSSGNGSRIESFSPIIASFVVGSTCH